MNDAPHAHTTAAWRGTALATAITGVLALLLQLKELLLGGAPVGPAIASGIFAAVSVAILLAYRRTATPRVCGLAFLANTANIVLTLWSSSSSRSVLAGLWTPFSASTLGVITLALLAPDLWTGLLSIVALVVLGVAKYATLSVAARAYLRLHQPWIVLTHGALALALLMYRVRSLALEQRYWTEHSERMALERLARRLIAMRDLANTPRQTILFSAALLRARRPELEEIIVRIEHALQRLEALDRVLDVNAADVEWQRGEESFDPLAMLDRPAHPPGHRAPG
jgi:hypothetical protein